MENKNEHPHNLSNSILFNIWKEYCRTLIVGESHSFNSNKINSIYYDIRMKHKKRIQILFSIKNTSKHTHTHTLTCIHILIYVYRKQKENRKF